MKTWMLAASLVALSGVALSGCTMQPAGPDPFLQAQIGHNEIDVVHAMGVPVHTYETNGHKFLAFEKNTQWVDNWGGGMYGGWHRWGGDWGPTEVDNLVCQVSFEFVDDKAIGYQVHGNGC